MGISLRPKNYKRDIEHLWERLDNKQIKDRKLKITKISPSTLFFIFYH